MGGAGAIEVYRKSVFCLSPTGDNPARKATFDALIAGCIPVFLDPDSFLNQYKLHLSLRQKRLMSVNFSPEQLLVSTNPILTQNKLSTSTVLTQC